jgi:hypothetical protein
MLRERGDSPQNEAASARSELRRRFSRHKLTGRKLKKRLSISPPTVWAISARAVVRREAAGEAPTMAAQPMAAPWVAGGWAGG